MAIDESPTASPPFNLLSLPFDLFTFLCKRLPEQRRNDHLKRAQASSSMIQTSSSSAVHGAAPGSSKHHSLKSIGTAPIAISRMKTLQKQSHKPADLAAIMLTPQSGERAARAMFSSGWVKDYMLEHLDGVVQEQRWRQNLTKSAGIRHRLLMTAMEESSKKLGSQLSEMLEDQLSEMRRSLDEVRARVSTAGQETACEEEEQGKMADRRGADMPRGGRRRSQRRDQGHASTEHEGSPAAKQKPSSTSARRADTPPTSPSTEHPEPALERRLSHDGRLYRPWPAQGPAGSRPASFPISPTVHI